MSDKERYAWIANRPMKVHCDCTSHWYTTHERIEGNPPVYQRIVFCFPVCSDCNCHCWVEVPKDKPKLYQSIRKDADNAKVLTKEEYDNEMCEMQNNRHERSAS